MLFHVFYLFNKKMRFLTFFILGVNIFYIYRFYDGTAAFLCVFQGSDFITVHNVEFDSPEKGCSKFATLCKLIFRHLYTLAVSLLILLLVVFSEVVLIPQEAKLLSGDKD